MSTSLDTYLDTLQVIAPGLLDEVQRQSMPGESWVDAATRIMSSLTMTAYQARLVSEQLQRARDGLPPAPIPDDPRAPNHWLPWLVLGGVALLALRN